MSKMILILAYVFLGMTGVVVDGTQNSKIQENCDTGYFDWDKYRCCSGRLYDRKSEEECCGNQVINTNNFWCEYGEIIPYQRSCGDQLYDTRDAVCCGGQLTMLLESSPVLQCCGSETYNPYILKCERNQVIPMRYGWCGEVPHDRRLNVCCNNQLYARTNPRTFCCGIILVNQSTIDCCNGHAFNTTTSQCCGGKVVDIGGECCGDSIISATTHICCNHVPVKRVSQNKNGCCNGKAYEVSTSRCILGRVKRRDVNLCGIRVYNKTTDRCCNYVLHRHAKIQGYRCCSPGYRIYNPKSQVCCNSVVKNGFRCTDLPDIRRPACTGRRERSVIKNAFCKKNASAYRNKRNRTKKNHHTERNHRLYKIMRSINKNRKSTSPRRIQIEEKRCKIFNEKKKYILIVDRGFSNFTIIRLSKKNKRLIRSYIRKCESMKLLYFKNGSMWPSSSDK